ncbi:putative para-aminobenzoate synthase component I [Mycobacterium kansasii]|uniref:Putative para-aminobenzoate synthase component I n=1 Tax=Mycobacterium kansasii TaxID=1768 RepID=A0A1V3XPM0_MYCKA|nr:putative para-aminobenzoate synthase component I [Mycobacterium kansasii]
MVRRAGGDRPECVGAAGGPRRRVSGPGGPGEPVAPVSGAVGGGWVGYLSYPDPGADGRGSRIPEAAGGWTDCVLRRDRDGHWWYESLSDAPMPDWLVSALATTPAPAGRPVPGTCRIDWAAADREAHRGGVLACLAAITAGEVYQACVCTQFTGTVSGSALDFFIDFVDAAGTSPSRAAYVGGPWARWHRYPRNFSCGATAPAWRPARSRARCHWRPGRRRCGHHPKKWPRTS